MPNLDFFKKGLGLVSAPRFVHSFEEKYLLCYILLSDQISLLLLLEISGIVSIVIVRYPVCDVISFEIYRSFLIKPLSYKAKKTTKI